MICRIEARDFYVVFFFISQHCQTALNWACEMGNLKVVKVLLAAGGADIEARDKVRVSWGGQLGWHDLIRG